MSLGEFLQRVIVWAGVYLISYLMFALIYWDILWVPLMVIPGRVIWIFITGMVAGFTGEGLELEFKNGN